MYFLYENNGQALCKKEIGTVSINHSFEIPLAVIKVCCQQSVQLCYRFHYIQSRNMQNSIKLWIGSDEYVSTCLIRFSNSKYFFLFALDTSYEMVISYSSVHRQQSNRTNADWSELIARHQIEIQHIFFASAHLLCTIFAFNLQWLPLPLVPIAQFCMNARLPS